MSTSTPQWLGRGENPARYMELIDEPSSEGYKIREQIIFPVLLPLMQELLGCSHTPMVDFGSGTGSLTQRLATTLGVLVEGVDAGRNFVKLARATQPQNSFYLTRGKAPVGYSLHHSNAHLVLHCTPQPEKLLENMTDVTEPGGYVFVTIPHPDSFKISHVRKHPERQSHIVQVGDVATMTYYHRTVSEHEAMFRRVGLTIVKRQECFASKGASATLAKYKTYPAFLVYALQKKIDTIDTALITESGSGKLLLLTRAADDDKFPGAKSLFSVRRTRDMEDGPSNLARGLRERLGLNTEYVSPHTIGSLVAKHKHSSTTQYANVNLYAVKMKHIPTLVKNQFYAGAKLIPPSLLRPSGGACTQLGYNFVQAHL